MSQAYQKNPVKPYKGEGYEGVVNRLSASCDEVAGDQFYCEIFPNNERRGYQHFNKHYQQPNAVYLYEDDRDACSQRRLRRRIMLADTWEDDYCKFIEMNPLTLCSGLSYRGRTNKLEHAQQMNAMIFDLDNVGVSEFMNLMLRFRFGPEQIRSLPTPTFIVASGSGLHLYYVLKTPVDLYPNIKLQLKALKYDLTFRMWDYEGTTQAKTIQYQGINQGFRMVGSINSKYNTVVRAFRTGPNVTLEYLNSYCNDKSHCVDITKPFRPTQMSLAQAKESYPEWYERRIVKGITGRHWTCKPALYEWWKRQIDDVLGGHRYFFLMCLAIYACKCDIPKETVKADMYALFSKLKSIKHDNPFTKADVESALETYDKAYYCFTINDIEKLSNIRIDRNKRNFRKQADHCKMMRLIRDEINGHKDTWRDGNGRKPKNLEVYYYRQAHPDARKADCIRDTKLAKHTVYKWWDWKPDYANDIHENFSPYRFL